MKRFSALLLFCLCVLIKVLALHKEYYEILELTPKASEADIKKAYRKLSQKYHPDRNAGDEEANQKFVKIAQGI